MQNLSNARLAASDFVKFLNKAVTPYHAVDECISLLKNSGFNELKENEEWSLEPAHKYYLTRNKSTIIAFSVGGKFRPGDAVAMIAAHTDSPCLRVKPISKLCSANFLQVGVSTYGGGLWRTWFDRDLTVAGRVLSKDKNGKIISHLVHIEKPIMSIPNLAIHLDRTSNESFTFNAEDHLRPILASQVQEKLKNEDCLPKKEDEKKTAHHPNFLKLIAENLNIEVDTILDFDLSVIDTQPATIGGLNEEFIYGPRLDNLVNTYCAITGLVKSCENVEKLKTENHIRLVICYDNEECGSESAQGAGSSMTEWVLRRLNSEMKNFESKNCDFERSIVKSFLISADQAHAQHPNYKAKHEENHTPRFHGGPVVKVNVNQRYATTTFTFSFLDQFARLADVPLQKFVTRNDMPCGSTVGPILSAKLGLKTVDIGMPQLAMHSIREMGCVSSIEQGQKLFQTYFERYDEVAAAFQDVE